MKDQIISDVSPSGRAIDQFILKNEILCIILSVQLNFSRVARLVVFFVGMVGQFWI